MINNLFKFFSYLFYFSFGFMTFLIIRIISPIKVIRFSFINSHRLGHFAQEWELFYQLNIRKKYNVVLLSFQRDISNKFLAKMIRRKIFILPSKFIKIIQLLNNSIFGNIDHEFKFHDLIYDTSFNKKNILKNNKPSLDFTKEEIIHGNNILKLFRPKKIVGIIVRDENYLGLGSKFKDSNNGRNSNIDDLILGIKYLEKKGYTVFRMGKIVKNKMKYTSPNVIDYANSKIRSDFMDLFLIKKCKFFISTGCGLDAGAMLFRKPILYLNYMGCTDTTYGTNRDLFAYKKLLNKKTRRYLKLSSIIKNDLDKITDRSVLKKKNIDVIKLNKSEIKNIIKEMEKFYQHKKYTKIQKIFELKYRNLVSEKRELKNRIGNLKIVASHEFLKNNISFSQ